MLSRRAMMNDEIVSADGKSLALERCKGSYLHGMNFYGRTTQETTTGAQLLPPTTKTAKAYDVTLTINRHEWSLTGVSSGNGGRNTLMQEITLPAGTYIAKTYPKVNGLCISDKETLSYISGSKFVLEEEKTVLIGLNVSEGVAYNEIFHVMLNPGTATLPWEPYTGGKPSPSPEYPQEMFSVGQYMTTGANLFDASNIENISNIQVDKNKITLTNVYSSSTKIAANSLFEPGKTYTCSAVLTGSQEGARATGRISLVKINDKDIILVPSFTGDVTRRQTINTVTMPEDLSGYILYFYGSSEDRVIFENVQFNSGSVALPYEPYTGGKPGLANKGIIARVEGKNLFSGFVKGISINSNNGTEGMEKNSASTGFIQVSLKDGESYYLSGLTNKLNSFVYAYDKNKKALDRTSGNAKTNLKITKEQFLNNSATDARFIRITTYKTTNNTGNIDDIDELKVQLEKGDQATAYQPYSSQSLTLSTPNGLPGIPVTSGGNYTDETGQQWICDEIDLKRGVYVQRVQRLVFDGTETWKITSGMFYNSNKNILKPLTSESGLCSHCEYRLNYGDTGKNIGLSKEPIVYVSREMTNMFNEDTDVWKTYLADQYANSSLFTVAYAIATPIETPIPPEELSAYRALHTNTPTTVISNDEDARMKVGYRRIRK